MLGGGERAQSSAQTPRHMQKYAFEDLPGARGGIGVQKLSRVAWVGARAGMSVRGVEVLLWLTRLGRLEGLGWWDGRRS